ncbi:MAG: inorganic diphosphatase [Bacteroidales bacterium]|jgi:inorganic pyrophosphatase
MNNRLPGYRQSSLLLMLIFLLSIEGCGNKQMRNFNAIPAFTQNHVNAVIEIPAGTNQKLEYNIEKKMFLVEQSNGSEQIIDFLPSPGNYGFVPGTFLDPVMGGNGDPIDILILSESLPTGTIIEVIPLLILYFTIDPGVNSPVTVPKIIAVPASEGLRIINAVNYEELFDNYPEIVDILTIWFQRYNKEAGPIELKAMGDGEVAVNEIRKWDIMRF